MKSTSSLFLAQLAPAQRKKWHNLLRQKITKVAQLAPARVAQLESESVAQLAPDYANIEYDKILVQLNNSHPAYTNLIEILDDTEISSDMKVEERLEKASMGLKLLLLSWARYEDEQVDKFRDRVKQVRREWGKVALDFLDNDDD